MVREDIFKDSTHTKAAKVTMCHFKLSGSIQVIINSVMHISFFLLHYAACLSRSPDVLAIGTM